MRIRRLPPAARPPRRGAILLVVLAMLALFAVLGLSFVLYAESSATAARINREAMDLNSTGGALTATIGNQEFADAAGKAVGQMLFDGSDTDPLSVTSGLRGYGLVRLKYGYDRTYANNAGLTPFAGQGLMFDGDSEDTTAPNELSALPGLTGVVRSGIVNYAWQPGSTYILDPEWTKFRTVTGNNVNTPPTTGMTNSSYRNIAAAYTYPDMKDLPLAVVSAQKDTANNPPKYDYGTVLQPSYFRYGPAGPAGMTPLPAWVFNSGQNDPMMRLAPPVAVSSTSNNGQVAGSDDWLIAAGRLKMIRPRPKDHEYDSGDGRGLVSDFPYVPMNPNGTYTGDVQNLPSAGLQTNDSLWIYPAGPVVTVNNKRYTALIAPLVLDLGGRVNLSTAGNQLYTTTAPNSPRPTGQDHGSSQGVGRWEVNPRWVLEPFAQTRGSLTPSSATALTSLMSGFTGFTEVGGTKKDVPGRYGMASLLPPTDPVTGQAYASANGLLNTGADPTLTIRTGPHYGGRMDFDAVGSTAAKDVALPVGGQNTPFPTFATTRYYDDSLIGGTGTVTYKNAEFVNHPAQFHPSFYPPTGTAGRTFPASDMRWLATRIGGKAEEYSNAEVARLMAAQLIAGGTDPSKTAPNNQRYDTATQPSGPQTFTATGVPAGTYNPSPYGPYGEASKDPAILSRLLVTTIGNSTSRPEFRIQAILRVDPATGASLDPTSGAPITVGLSSGTVPLGPVDLARSLPDYRYNPNPSTPLPMTGTPPTSWEPDTVYGPGAAAATEQAQRNQVQAAQSARQRLARDIFVRLVGLYSNWQIATNVPQAQVLVNGQDVAYVNDPAAADFGHLRIQTSVSGPTSPETDKFKTLRQLAQLAVNIVDHIDPDDVSTPFLWSVPTGSFPADTTGFYTSSGYSISVAEGRHLVFGAELPRLALNEAYACVTNKDFSMAMTATTSPVTTHFWVELHNPLSDDATLSNSGAARLVYNKTPPGTPSPGTTNQTTDVVPYQIAVVDVSAATDSPVSTKLAADPTNVLGLPQGTALAPNGTLKLLIGNTGGASDFDAATVIPDPSIAGDAFRYVLPNNGLASHTNKNKGYYVIGPNDPTNTFPTASFAPSVKFPLTGTGTTPPVMTITASGFTETDIAGNGGTVIGEINRKYSIVLRRLANPYLPEQSNLNVAFYNPYITIDVLDGVQPRDRVAANDTGMHTVSQPATVGLPLGRKHPYGAVTTAAQTGSGNPPHTFFQANSNVTPGSVMNWLAHLDRQPLNPVEIASASAVSPPLLTTNFATGAAPYNFNKHTAERLLMPIPDQTTLGGRAGGGLMNFGFPLPNNLAGGELHQALDFLAVRCPVSTSAVGTPEAGRLNLNAINHPSVLRALFDPDTTTTSDFPPNLFEERDLDSALGVGTVPGFWQKLTGKPADQPTYPAVAFARSPAYPNVSLTNDATTRDNPIKALSGLWVTGTPLANQLQQTILRTHDSSSTSPTLFMNPLENGSMTAGTFPVEAKDHISLKAEPMRKVWNNSSTTSDTFLVVMTVAFFEIRHEDPTSKRVYLGKELFKDSPGDMRQKFAAVIDRSESAVELNYDTAGTPTRSGNQDAAKPWFSVLSTDILPGNYDITDTSANPLSGVAPFNPTAYPPYNPNAAPMGNPLTCEIEAKLSGTAAIVYTSVPQATQALQEVKIDPMANPKPTVRIGFGDAALNGGEGEYFTVTGVTASLSGIPGRVLLTLQPNGLTNPGNPSRVIRYHPAGSVVTNVLLGNPGPQPAFNPTAPRYQSLVRYFGRMTQ